MTLSSTLDYVEVVQRGCKKAGVIHPPGHRHPPGLCPGGYPPGLVQTDERPGGKADVLADAFDSVKADQSRCPGSGVEKLRSQEN